MRRHQMPRQQPTQHTRTTRDQHRPRPVQHRKSGGGVVGRGRVGPDEARRVSLLLPYRDLRLAAGESGGDSGRGVGGEIEVEVHQHQASGVLRLGAAYQSPDGGGGRVGHLLGGDGGHRAAGHHGQGRPRCGECGVGEPCLNEFERLEHQLSGGDGHAVRLGELGRVDDNRRELAVSCGQERGDVGVGRESESEGVGAEDGPLGLWFHVPLRGDGLPVHTEEGVMGDGGCGGELVRGDRAGHQRGDGEDGAPFSVRDLEGEPVRPGTRQADTHRFGTDGEQRNAGPGERQPQRVIVTGREPPRVQHGVQQRGVDAVATRLGAHVFGQGDVGEDLVTAPPGRLQPLEPRPVAVTGFGRGRVELGQIHRPGVGGRPGGELERGSRGGGLLLG